MPTLGDAILELAKIVGDVLESTATSGSGTYLTDSTMKLTPGSFADGTLWVLSGYRDGLIQPIVTNTTDTITFSTSGSVIANGDSYAIAPPKFSFSHMRLAIQTALNSIYVLQVYNDEVISYADITVTDDRATLPDDVFNVKRVKDTDGNINYYWREQNGLLYFKPNKGPTTIGELWYEAPHPKLSSDADAINSAVDMDWLKWSAAVNLWRRYIQDTLKDNPTAADMLNEAEVNEANARSMADRRSRKMARDPMLASW